MRFHTVTREIPKRKEEPKHITWKDLDEKDQFFGLLQGRKRLMDTVKMISYRAESALAALLKKPTVDMATAHRLLQDLYVAEADILPRPEENLLLVRVHNCEIIEPKFRIGKEK